MPDLRSQTSNFTARKDYFQGTYHFRCCPESSGVSAYAVNRNASANRGMYLAFRVVRPPQTISGQLSIDFSYGQTCLHGHNGTSEISRNYLVQPLCTKHYRSLGCDKSSRISVSSTPPGHQLYSVVVGEPDDTRNFNCGLRPDYYRRHVVFMTIKIHIETTLRRYDLTVYISRSDYCREFFKNLGFCRIHAIASFKDSTSC